MERENVLSRGLSTLFSLQNAIDATLIKMLYQACADPESFVRVGPILTFFFF